MPGEEFLPLINPDRRTGCGLGAWACVSGVLALRNKKPAVFNPEACHYSGTCREICPPQVVGLAFEVG